LGKTRALVDKRRDKEASPEPYVTKIGDAMRREMEKPTSTALRWGDCRVGRKKAQKSRF